jgi:hypothetical protein
LIILLNFVIWDFLDKFSLLAGGLSSNRKRSMYQKTIIYIYIYR